jgi:hypothetical protein
MKAAQAHVPVERKRGKPLKVWEVSPIRNMWSETLDERTPTLERRGKDEVAAPTSD